MTKKDLERRNEFLLLQLKIIYKTAMDTFGKSNDEIAKALGHIEYYSSAEAIKGNIEFIEEHNKKYNFFHETMDIKEYK